MSDLIPTIPATVLAAYNLEGAQVMHIPSLINSTFVLQPQGARQRVVLQQLHPVFGARVHEDIEAVTRYLETKGMETPYLVRTATEALWFETPPPGATHIWRAQTYVDGITHHRDCTPAALSSAAELLAKFHSLTSDFDYQFVHCRPIHDTPARLAELRTALNSKTAARDTEAQELGKRILKQAEVARLDFGALPERVIHGDPKISNLLFWQDDPERARCLIDLDTVGRGTLAYELGDALRSWTNPAGEDVSSAHVQLELFAATMKGYSRGKHESVSAEELASFVDGLETVSLELASRYAADVVVDKYWGWDATRFASRREHNLLRARGQLALSLDVRAKRTQLEALALEG